MSTTYAQKQAPAQKKEAPTASSVLDSSSQSEGLQRKADMTNNAAQREETPRPNNTGMPDNLKSGIESLSGFSMDDVRVHYNSNKPATVQALAYTQGTDIHVAPGQEKHLPHEAWHVAQQMAGRVSPTTNINGMPVNDNAGLEHEADVMGEKAVQRKEYLFHTQNTPICASAHLTNHNKIVAQRMWSKNGQPIKDLATLNTHLLALNPSLSGIDSSMLHMEINHLIKEFCNPLDPIQFIKEKLDDLKNELINTLIEKNDLYIADGIKRKDILKTLKETIVNKKAVFWDVIQQYTPFKHVGKDFRLNLPGGFKVSGQGGKYYGNTEGWHIHEYTTSYGDDGHVKGWHLDETNKKFVKDGEGRGQMFSHREPEKLLAAIQYICSNMDDNAKICFAYLRYYFWISTGKRFDISDSISSKFLP